MNRRTMLAVSAAGGVGVACGAGRGFRRWRPGVLRARRRSCPSRSTRTRAFVQSVSDVPKLVKTEAEWRRQLTPIEFEVTRRAATERPFTGATWNLHDQGLYRCVCCGTALFSSKAKFDSNTGWPSFWTPLDKRNIEEHSDFSFGMVRTAVSCRRCDAHLGHVFDDGPQPTGLRYCMNSAAMRFVKA